MRLEKGLDAANGQNFAAGFSDTIALYPGACVLNS